MPSITRVDFQTAVDTNTVITVPVNCTGASMLVVGVYEDVASGNANHVASMTYNGVETPTFLIDEYRTFSAGFISSLWALPSPSAGTNDVVVTLTGSETFHVFAWSLAGADTTLPTGAALAKFSSNSASASTMTPTSIADGSWALTVLRNLDGNIADSTNYVSLVGALSVSAGDSNGSTGPAGVVTVEGVRASSRWGGCVTALFAPSATPPPVTVKQVVAGTGAMLMGL